MPAMFYPMRTVLLKILFPALLLLPGLQRAAAQGVEAYAQFDSNLVETGNPFAMHLAVPKDAGKPVKIVLSAWDSLIPERNVLTQSGWNVQGDRYVNDLKLICFDADTIQLPPLPIELSNDQTAYTAPQTLVVLPTPSPQDPNDLADIKDIHPEPFHWADALGWVAVIGGLLLLAGLAYWLLRRYKKTKSVISRSTELPPHILAMKKLDALAAKQLWQKGQVKAYYAELTYIIREYLEKRYGVPALESTSDEILRRIDRLEDFPDALRRQLQDMLMQADLAKFAKGNPPVEFHEQALSDARRLAGREA